MARRQNREQERQMTYHTAPRYYIKRAGKYMDASGNFTRTLLDAFFATNRQVAEDFARREGGKVVKRNPFFRKTRVRRRVRKALKKYVRGNPRAGSRPYWIAYHDDMYGEYMVTKVRDSDAERNYGRVIARSYKKSVVSKAAKSAARRHARGFTNPARVKGRKTKGGRAVTLRNFTGTIVKKSDGTVQIVGRGRKK